MCVAAARVTAACVAAAYMTAACVAATYVTAACGAGICGIGVCGCCVCGCCVYDWYMTGVCGTAAPVPLLLGQAVPLTDRSADGASAGRGGCVTD